MTRKRLMHEEISLILEIDESEEESDYENGVDKSMTEIVPDKNDPQQEMRLIGHALTKAGKRQQRKRGRPSIDKPSVQDCATAKPGRFPRSIDDIRYDALHHWPMPSDPKQRCECCIKAYSCIKCSKYNVFLCMNKEQEAFDLILEENSDSELEGEDGWRRVGCDAKSSYAWKIQIYKGKLADGQPDKNQGMRAVLDLIEGLRLLKRKISMVGTVRKNKPELPPALLASKEKEVFSSKFAFTPTTTLVSYLPKKNKNKDNHNYGLQSKQRRCGQSRHGNWSIQLQKDDCPLAMFHNIIDISSYNAFVIWREINLTWMSHKSHKRRVFLEQLGKALVAPLIERRKNVPRTEASAQIVKAFQSAGLLDRPDEQASTSTFKASKRKRCQFCPKEKDNKTNNTCFKCNKYKGKGCSSSYCAQ
ncbi:unnamed protein product [Lepeophtheirus salmonis]|uniref:(salmon louse) hypothetical protein n=1 Tax=Lepeophtheirus salmonis TaxID=72036 RepID=A0A7R8CPV4_LEPSM|nr:unnamed protein product [Lepeophtheirus salmonis]CAF2854414.1 unnamed protein product [Lepeophtheirus salmonis]